MYAYPSALEAKKTNRGIDYFEGFHRYYSNLKDDRDKSKRSVANNLNDLYKEI